MNIRLESTADIPAIHQLNCLAFGQDGEARLVDALRDGGFVRVSLVAEVDGRIVGHILFSDLPIVSTQGIVPALSLAPMAVLPDQQGKEIGSQLVRHGLDICRQEEHKIVVVLGHPHYYSRFGFSADLAKPLNSTFSGDAWMALELTPGALSGIAGTVQYPPPFLALG